MYYVIQTKVSILAPNIICSDKYFENNIVLFFKFQTKINFNLVKPTLWEKM